MEKIKIFLGEYLHTEDIFNEKMPAMYLKGVSHVDRAPSDINRQI